MTVDDCEVVRYDAWSTAWGPIGAAVGAGGLIRLILPHGSREDILAELARLHVRAARHRGALADLRELTRAYFDGCEVDFRDVRCVLPPAKSFAGKVLRACREIVFGKTAGYSALAGQMGRPRAARAVASALGRNPIPLVVPCHRITYADGSLGGFSAAGGVELKRRMLALEGVHVGQ